MHGCTRKGHEDVPIIPTGKINCDHCIRDQKFRSRNHQINRTERRRFKSLLKQLHPGQVKVLDSEFAQMDSEIRAGKHKSSVEKTRVLRRIHAGICFVYPLSELQILKKNWNERVKRKSISL